MASSKTMVRAAMLLIAAGLATDARAQWVPNYQHYSIQRIGLFGPANTGDAGLQISNATHFKAPGFVVGTSNRYMGTFTDNGRDAWAWNGSATIQIGLIGGANTGSAGRQISEPLFQNGAGQVAGSSERFRGVGTFNGRDAWAWNGTTTTQIGLTGGVYTGSAGFQLSELRSQNGLGHVTGYSDRYIALSSLNGRDAWVWNGTTTTRIGLTGGIYIDSAGREFSEPELLSGAGQVAGYSTRYPGGVGGAGRDAWVWNGSTTTQIGLAGGAYTGSAGRQHIELMFQNEGGQVAGYSQRITGVSTSNGQDAWVWNGTTTTQIGFTGGVYTSSTGLQFSELRFQNQAGQVAGYSNRYPSEFSDGRVAWVWNGTNTTQIGFTGGVYTGNDGRQSSAPLLQNDAGQVAGTSSRYVSGNTSNGQDAWVWNGTHTTQIGLTGGANTGSGGRQSSEPQFQNGAGQVAGYSDRYRGLSTLNGVDAWVWNGTTTTQIGLTGGVYTGSTGYQTSFPQLLNEAGQVAGYSRRYSGVSTQIGIDAWYFDPETLLSHAIVGSVRTSDNYAFSQPTILTDGGFLLGHYTYFPGGLGSGEQRAFIFRPDLGLTDLGNLVDGGLTLNGWSTLQNPLFADTLDSIVGYGRVRGVGQAFNQSVFVMTIPAPSAFGLLGLGGLLAARSRRR